MLECWNCCAEIEGWKCDNSFFFYEETTVHRRLQNSVLTLVLPPVTAHVCMHAKSLQSCLTLCDFIMDCSLPGSSVHGILQARILEWVAIPSFKGSSRQAYKQIGKPKHHGRSQEGTINSGIKGFRACVRGITYKMLSRTATSGGMHDRSLTLDIEKTAWAQKWKQAVVTWMRYS